MLESEDPPKGRLGLCEEEAESSRFQPQHPSDRACGTQPAQPYISNHRHFGCEQAEKTRGRKKLTVRDLQQTSENPNYPKIIPIHPLLLLSGKPVKNHIKS